MLCCAAREGEAPEPYSRSDRGCCQSGTGAWLQQEMVLQFGRLKVRKQDKIGFSQEKDSSSLSPACPRFSSLLVCCACFHKCVFVYGGRKTILGASSAIQHFKKYFFFPHTMYSSHIYSFLLPLIPPGPTPSDTTFKHHVFFFF